MPTFRTATPSPPLRLALVLLAALAGGCATAPDSAEEAEPTYVPDEPDTAEPIESPEVADAAAVAEPAPTPQAPVASLPESQDRLEQVVIAVPRERDDIIRDLVAEARVLLRDVELRYVFVGKGRRETLRGRPVAFAVWSEKNQKWSIVHVEIPRPPVRWKPGGRPLRFVTITPGFTVRHVKGTGAERLMFSFARDGEALKVYGRKFPVFDSNLLAKRRWRAVVQTAKPIVYLPFTKDTLDPLFVSGGREYLLATARKAIDELRLAQVPSQAFPGTALADLVPAEVIATLAVIEQTDDTDYRNKQAAAFDEVLNQYGLKREEAYRYSVSRAAALGPMQFTNRRGNGTYSLVVRRCRGANIDPVFERGATDLLNAMKAAICLFDIELGQMPDSIRLAYRDNTKVLGIFPVAAYNGGPRNVARLNRVIERMGLDLVDLRAPAVQPEDRPVSCPCLWAEAADGIRPVSIPRYNNENRWYIEKYQSILSSFEEEEVASTDASESP